ncbi:metalloregulator ArsR/SmtB family transcription factor [Devosia sp. ZB163]|uniref:ArsR/SmtB family transcription factor n=1 Tax=Devosia sp. ZB163 TaxID=3025938 RepID=UPI00235E1721|nr:metalloregulator ArsR/SmtB family transcription factor [Devosia sp. ZB163]MDC9825916.1 metalloregulator ArsR/SmtB family transcription factor [Devosia sp. ZB163]
MAQHQTQLDDVFLALADPTRRAVIARLGRNEASVSELAAPFEMALPSFMKHIRVLEDAGLIHTSKHGRVRTCRIDTARLSLIDGWLDEQRRTWEGRTDRLEQFLLGAQHKDGHR